MKRLTWLIAVGVGCMFLFGIIVSRADPSTTPRTMNSGQHFLPPYPSDRDRFGFDSERSHPLTEFDVAQLNAGWYSDWGYSANPAHPDHLTYVQLIRFSAGSCGSLYTDPAEVKVSPSKATMAQIAAAQPGSLWMLSNEPDSCYQGNPVLPEVYAHVYHEYYHYIKSVDPTAVIANGGIVQPTPCRMMYLDVMLDTYEQAYGEPMPVDVWNIHAFALREVWGSWGASTPPGVPKSCGIEYEIRDADDIDIFRDNLIAFREWMKDRGEQDKPLIISEYGILWPDWLADEDGRKFTPARVSAFMVETFDLFLGETYPEIGLPQDNGRLVQAWAWYSLSDKDHYNGYLFDSDTKAISMMGQAYADYTAALPIDDLYVDLSASLWVDESPLTQLAPLTPYNTTSATLSVVGSVANLGKTAAENALVTAPSLDYQDAVSVSGRYETDVETLPLPSLVITQSGIYDVNFIIDPEQAIDDARRWNNTYSVTVDARPDLSVLTPTWGATMGDSNHTLNVTWTVLNEGTWPSPSLSGTLRLSDTQNSDHSFEEVLISPIASGGGGVTTGGITPPDPAGGVYSLTMVVDGAGRVDERDKTNNRGEVKIDIRPDLAILETMAWTSALDVLSVTFTIVNSGTWPSWPVSGTLSLSDGEGTIILPDHFTIPTIDCGQQETFIRRLSLPPLESGLYELKLEVDSAHALDELNENNNQTISEIDLRPDLAIDAALQSVQLPRAANGYARAVLTVTNIGVLTSDPVSGTTSLGNQQGSLLLPYQNFSVPALKASEWVTLAQETTLSASGVDIYYFGFEIDRDNILNEIRKDNNQAEIAISAPVTVSLEPGLVSTLTSISGRMSFAFPASTVTTTTMMLFTPRPLSKLPSGPIVSVDAFDLTAYRDEQPISFSLPAPVTFTWRYADDDVPEKNERSLGVYRLGQDNHWQAIAPMVHHTQENWLRTGLPQLGVYACGYSHRLYIPFVLRP